MSYADPAKAPKDGKVITEAPGLVTSDSLAAESYAQGQRQNDSSAHFDAVPQAVPSKGTTANTTDNINATILPPAAAASTRGTDQQTYTTPADSGERGDDAVPAAPSYVSASMNASGGEMPKGDATEGGFDDAKASRPKFNAEPGSRADPGREAVKAFEYANARNAAAEGSGGYTDDQGGFENLSRDAPA